LPPGARSEERWQIRRRPAFVGSDALGQSAVFEQPLTAGFTRAEVAL
jgi:hypothetical protein